MTGLSLQLAGHISLQSIKFSSSFHILAALLVHRTERNCCQAATQS